MGSGAIQRTSSLGLRGWRVACARERRIGSKLLDMRSVGKISFFDALKKQRPEWVLGRGEAAVKDIASGYTKYRGAVDGPGRGCCSPSCSQHV